MRLAEGWRLKADNSSFCLQPSSSSLQPSPASSLQPPAGTRGFTLVEVLLAGVTLAVAIAAIIGAYVGQMILNEHARNLSIAVQDANRVVERIRQAHLGSPCNVDLTPPVGANWNDWLQLPTAGGGGGGKIIPPAPATNELIVVTCQNREGTQYCRDTQMGTEWHAVGPAVTENPLRVTVSVCWRERNRTIGECTWNGASLAAADGQNGPNDVAGVIESPAMITTLVTCR